MREHFTASPTPFFAEHSMKMIFFFFFFCWLCSSWTNTIRVPPMHVMRKFVGKMAGSMAGVIVLTASSSNCDNRRQSVKDCEHPACASKMDLFKRAQSAYPAPRDETTKGLTGSDGHSSVITSSSPPVNNCPLDREELGRSTWNLLHTIAAYYPDQPTAAEQESVRQLFVILAQFYPCEVCAQDFRDSVAANPPRY